MSKRLRILLADDNSGVRVCLAAALNQDPSLDVVGEASDGQMAVELSRKLLPDVVIMDVRMPALSGIEATRRIVSDHPGITVIALSLHSDGNLAVEIQKAGGAACISKCEPIQVLVAAIHASRPM